MLTPGTERALVAIVSQHRRTHPKHAHIKVRQLHGMCRSLDMRLNDDPALAAYQLIDYMPRVIGLARALLEWGTVVSQCEPHEAPDHGARL